jgi:hypothetical protein
MVVREVERRLARYTNREGALVPLRCHVAVAQG